MSQSDDHPENVPLESMDVTEDKRHQLKQLFPEVFTESENSDGDLVEAIDFEKLQEVLGETSEILDQKKERYGLEWPGKRDCLRAIQSPTHATLKPNREQSVNFDDTQNVFIEGDNLEVLKLLQKSYYGKVKMIYIDPPYNTGKDFIYPDNYTESLETYMAYTGQVDGDGVKFSANSKDSGRFHSNWLRMMYPRLYLARNLLREDGFFLVSCDDAELQNLTHLLNQIFGEENTLGILVWDRNRKNDARYLSVGHEYMILVAKNADHLAEQKIILRTEKPGILEAESKFSRLAKKHKQDWEKVREEWLKFYNNLPASDPRKPLARFKKMDEKGPYRDDGDISWPGGGGPRYDLLHPENNKPCRVPTPGWRYPSKEKMLELVKKGIVVFGDDETTTPMLRTNLFDQRDQVLRTVHFSYAQKASKEFDNLFGLKVFDNPKNFRDLTLMLKYLTAPGDLALDFFAGSASTGHGAFQAALEGHPLNWILVQLPEPIPEKGNTAKNARSLGAQTIADIARERLRRAGAVASQTANADDTNPELALREIEPPDLGFRSFSLKDSNFIHWNNTVPEDANDLPEQLEAHVDHIDPSATEEDLLYEILLKSGFLLTEPMEVLQLAGKTVHSVQEGGLLICLEKQVTADLIRAVADAGPFQFVCLDSAFDGDDQLKTNAVQTFRSRKTVGEDGIQFRTV